MKFAKYVFGAVAALAVLTLFHIDPALAQEAGGGKPPSRPSPRSMPATRPGCSPRRRWS